MEEPVIRVENLGKRYRIGSREEARLGFAGKALDLALKPFEYMRYRWREPDPNEVLWALRGVSFELHRGDVLGIVGSNGSGKSTLLKLLSRITQPTEGEAWLRGRVSSLLEVGTGFHPELTGRENVYMNGAILGMTKREVDRKFEAILDFAGTGRMIDTPVKRYSSGMRVRLGFAVAAHLEPDVLLIDEVLAVGDAEFRRKCVDRMDNVASEEGRTILFVSHNMDILLSLCPRAIWLDKGQIRQAGPANEIVTAYLADCFQRSEVPLGEREDRGGDGRWRFTRFTLRDKEGNPVTTVSMGSEARLCFEYESQPGALDGEPVTLLCRILDERQRVVLELRQNDVRGFDPAGEVTCSIPRWPLAAGQYSVEILAALGAARRVSDHVTEAGSFDACEGDFHGTGAAPESVGAFICDYAWSLPRNEP